MENFIPVKIKFKLYIPKIGSLPDESWKRHCSLNEHTTFGNTKESKNFLEGNCMFLGKITLVSSLVTQSTYNKKILPEKDVKRFRDQANGTMRMQYTQACLGNGK